MWFSYWWGFGYTLYVYSKGRFTLQTMKDGLCQGRFTPWTMNLSHSHPKLVIGCWTRPGSSSVYTKQKCQRAHRYWGPQKTIFKPCSIHWHGPTVFLLGRAKEVVWEKQPGAHGRKMPKKNFNNFYLPRRSHCRLLLTHTNGLISGHIEKAVLRMIFHFSFLQHSSDRVIGWDFFS